MIKWTGQFFLRIFKFCLKLGSRPCPETSKDVEIDFNEIYNTSNYVTIISVNVESLGFGENIILLFIPHTEFCPDAFVRTMRLLYEHLVSEIEENEQKQKVRNHKLSRNSQLFNKSIQKIIGIRIWITINIVIGFRTRITKTVTGTKF